MFRFKIVKFKMKMAARLTTRATRHQRGGGQETGPALPLLATFRVLRVFRGSNLRFICLPGRSLGEGRCPSVAQNQLQSTLRKPTQRYANPSPRGVFSRWPRCEPVQSYSKLFKAIQRDSKGFKANQSQSKLFGKKFHARCPRTASPGPKFGPQYDSLFEPFERLGKPRKEFGGAEGRNATE